MNKNGCLVTGNKNKIILDVCRIISDPECKEERDIKMSHSSINGIVMRNDLCTLFNHYQFSINPETQTIETSKKYKLNFEGGQDDMDGKKIVGKLCNLQLQLMKKHYETFKKKLQYYAHIINQNEDFEFVFQLCNLDNEKFIKTRKLHSCYGNRYDRMIMSFELQCKYYDGKYKKNSYTSLCNTCSTKNYEYCVFELTERSNIIFDDLIKQYGDEYENIHKIHSNTCKKCEIFTEKHKNAYGKIE